MTNRGNRAKRFFHSLYVRLVLVIIFGVAVSVGVFVLARYFGNSYINDYYIADDQRTQREEGYIENLREFIRKNSISSEDTDKIAEWAQNNRYVYLLIYKNNELFFSSDMIPSKPVPDDSADDSVDDSSEDNPDGDNESENGSSSDTKEPVEEEPDGGSIGSGVTVDYPTREELKKYAEENDLYELEMVDGVLFAAVAEFTEYLYYDIANIASLVLAMLLLSIILINYLRRIVARVKKLERNVMVVAGGNINQPIESKGYDEIARLSENVENMRRTILESIEEERLARQANTELITAMSHDVRTPLTVLLGYLDIMKNEAEGETMQSYVEATEKTALRLKNLSDDMFNYFLAYGNTEESVDTEEYDAATLFDQMLSEHLLLLGEQGYDVILKKNESGFVPGSVVVTDAPKLMRIIDNLFSNLRKYANSEKPILVKINVTKRLFALEIENYICHTEAEVESNGIGLKTCQRLAPFVAEAFEFDNIGDRFVTKLRVKIIPPEDNK